MNPLFNASLLSIVAAMAFALNAGVSQEVVPKSETVIEPFLIEGKLADGESKLVSLIKQSPDSDQLQMELGFVRFFQAIERMGQKLHSFGPEDTFAMGQIPFLRLPVPKSKEPKTVTLKDVRNMVQTLINDLDEVEETLAKVDSDSVALPLRILQVRLDLDADGTATEAETLAPILTRYLGGRRLTSQQMEALQIESIRFDRADVDWLRGYCCLLRSMGEVFLAYDETPFWDVVARRFFEKGQSGIDFLQEEQRRRDDFMFEVIDIVAAVHNIRFEIREPERMKVAHQHLLDTIRHSREMWKRINAETDDDREWIPSPSQSNPFSDTRVTRRMTESWTDFLNEGEKILNGDLLIPFWRGTKKERGLDLHKFFHEPEDFDLVLWIHGSGAIPFLREGECSQPETWREFQRVFQGNFLGFAVWFN